MSFKGDFIYLITLKNFRIVDIISIYANKSDIMTLDSLTLGVVTEYDILENGAQETYLSKKRANPILSFFKKVLKLDYNKETSL